MCVCMYIYIIYGSNLDQKRANKNNTSNPILYRRKLDFFHQIWFVVLLYLYFVISAFNLIY